MKDQELQLIRIKKANDCYKKCKGDCLVVGTLRLYSYCNYCKKLKLQNKEIKIPEYRIQKFKFPIDFTDFPFASKGSIIKKNKDTLNLYLKGYYGDYVIETFRNSKLMDYRVFLIILYLADYHNNANFKEKFIEFLALLKRPDTLFYRKSILEGLDYLKKTTFYTPYIYDLKLKQRSKAFSLTNKGEIDYKNLPSFSVWSILNSYHHTKEKGKRKSKIEVRINEQYFGRIVKGRYYKLIELKKILPLKDIALKLYFFIIKYDPKNISNYPIDFNLFKIHIGIYDQNITNAKKTFKKAWISIKRAGLLKGYQHRFFTSKKGKEKIKFKKLTDLMKVYRTKL